MYFDLNVFQVGVNHFGHFYLNHLMLPRLANDVRIVVTASSVHDPESPGGAQGERATLGNLNGLQQYGKECEMIDGNPFNADKAYKDSKVSMTFNFEYKETIKYLVNFINQSVFFFSCATCYSRESYSDALMPMTRQKRYVSILSALD